MICTSFGNIGYNELLDLLPKCEMAEIRLDMLDLNDSEIANIFSVHPNLIATCRPNKIGIDEQKRRLKTAIESGASMVDLEEEAPVSLKIEMMGLACQYQCRVIISYHNYDRTPSSAELNAIVETIIKEGADIVKVATMAKSKADAARILGLYEHFPSLVAIAMGKDGIATRIAAPLLGAPFTFAAPSNDKTAPGQLIDNDMRTIYQILSKDA